MGETFDFLNVKICRCSPVHKLCWTCQYRGPRRDNVQTTEPCATARFASHTHPYCTAVCDPQRKAMRKNKTLGGPFALLVEC